MSEWTAGEGRTLFSAEGWLRDEGDPIRKAASPGCRVFMTVVIGFL